MNATDFYRFSFVKNFHNDLVNLWLSLKTLTKWPRIGYERTNILFWRKLFTTKPRTFDFLILSAQPIFVSWWPSVKHKHPDAYILMIRFEIIHHV